MLLEDRRRISNYPNGKISDTSKYKLEPLPHCDYLQTMYNSVINHKRYNSKSVNKGTAYYVWYLKEHCAETQSDFVETLTDEIASKADIVLAIQKRVFYKVIF